MDKDSRNHFIRRAAAFWTEDRSLSALLILLFIQIFIVTPLHTYHHYLLRSINGFVCSFFLIAGLLATTQRLLTRCLLFGLIATAITVRWRLLTTPPAQGLMVADSFLTLCTALFFTTAVLWKVYSDGQVSAHRVRGAIACYLLFGFTFSAAYRLLYHTLPGSLSLNPTLVHQGKDMSDILLYFSFVTLTTVGFGDVTAIHPLARSFVMLESIIGTLYPAILLARLVSQQIEQEKNLPQ